MRIVEDEAKEKDESLRLQRRDYAGERLAYDSE